MVNDAIHVNDESGLAADLVNCIHFRPQTLTVFRCAKQNHFRLRGGEIAGRPGLERTLGKDAGKSSRKIICPLLQLAGIIH
jgi:hypothetical protein